MIGNWLQRKRLVSQGMACDKKRRTSGQVEWRTFLETHPAVRIAACLAYVFLTFFFGTLYSDPLLPPIYLLTGIFLLSSMLLLKLDLEEIWKSNSKLFLLFLSITINLLISKTFFLGSVTYHKVPLAEIVFWIPTAFAPLLITVLLGVRAGLYTVVVSSLLDSLLVNEAFPFAGFPRLIIGLIVGFTAVLFCRHVRRRGDLIRAGVAIGIASLVCAVAFGLISRSLPNVLIEQAILGVGVGVFTAVVVNSILPIVESVFNINTDLSWIELADLNHPLLRQLTLEAPGTYHHSLVVANLAEAAATAIGAHGTLCRVMAYFHDIGKLTKPEYFSENSPAGSENPHDALSPTMSSLIIISHVKEGVDLAVKHRLKKPIIDAIREHHGNSKVYYFYRRALQMAEDAKSGSEIMNLREEDVPDVPEENFRYPGPIPQSKETGLIMLADAIEGASRSLEKPTPQRIEDMVQTLVAQRIADHQLDDSTLSLKDIRQASEAYIFTLKTMLHSRISYPKNESHTSSGSIQPAKRVPTEHEETRPPAQGVS